MNSLTKVFVVLLVVLSLLQTAAVVVYVNKEDFNRTAFKQNKELLDAKTAELDRVREDLVAAQANAAAIQNESNNQLAAAGKASTDAQQKVSELNVELAKAQGTIAAQTLDVNHLTEGLKAAQDTGGKLQQEVGRLRGSNDQLVKQTTELNATVSDLSNKLDMAERERKFLAEQYAELQAQSAKLSAAAKAAGVNPDQATSVAARTAPPIAGVIRDVRNISGMTYATISVGSADQVAPGMEFKVINKSTGDYLGRLVVDSVNANESTGRLEGPNVAAIKPGLEVRTQL